MAAIGYTLSSEEQGSVACLTMRVDAGYDHACVPPVGPNKEGFFDLYESKVLPELQ